VGSERTSFLSIRGRIQSCFFAALVLCAAFLLVTCSSPTPAATVTSNPTAVTSVASTPTGYIIATPTAPGTPTRTPTPSPLPPVSTSPSPGPSSPASRTPHLVVLVQNLGLPDDLVLAPDHSIYFSDVGDGTIRRLGADGQVTLIISNLQEPEGLVFLPDGSLLVAEQGKNRLLRFDLTTKQLVTFLQLENRTGHPGLDGIALDRKTTTVVVPDSPNGSLLRVNADGTNVHVIARGMLRPTGADVEPDGSILIADENGNAIRRLPANGSAAQLVARVPIPDDVIVDAGGNIYANTLGDGAIHHIDARTGKDQIIWRGLSNPQGLIFDADGNLIVADPGNHRIVKLIIK
jgi:sugar lactone lactonase YvrE